MFFDVHLRVPMYTQSHKREIYLCPQFLLPQIKPLQNVHHNFFVLLPLQNLYIECQYHIIHNNMLFLCTRLKKKLLQLKFKRLETSFHYTFSIFRTQLYTHYCTFELAVLANGLALCLIAKEYTQTESKRPSPV